MSALSKLFVLAGILCLLAGGVVSFEAVDPTGPFSQRQAQFGEILILSAIAWGVFAAAARSADRQVRTPPASQGWGAPPPPQGWQPPPSPPFPSQQAPPGPPHRPPTEHQPGPNPGPNAPQWPGA